jgi:hypothetical protein
MPLLGEQRFVSRVEQLENLVLEDRLAEILGEPRDRLVDTSIDRYLDAHPRSFGGVLGLPKGVGPARNVGLGGDHYLDRLGGLRSRSDSCSDDEKES